MRAPVTQTKPIEDVTVILDEAHQLGEFANAIRVVEEAGPDVFLDFLKLSVREKKAEVVSRVRVRRVFLPRIRELLGAVDEGEGMTVIFGETDVAAMAN